MSDALSVLLCENAKSLSVNMVSHLKAQWADDQQQWSRRDLSQARHVYWWTDGIPTGLCIEQSEGQCLLVIIVVLSHESKKSGTLFITPRRQCRFPPLLARQANPAPRIVSLEDGAIIGVGVSLMIEAPFFSGDRCGCLGLLRRVSLRFFRGYCRHLIAHSASPIPHATAAPGHQGRSASPLPEKCAVRFSARCTATSIVIVLRNTCLTVDR